MNVEIIAICDAATDSGGKLNILGAFDCLWAHQVPVVHPQCAIALRIRFARVEEGEHRLRVNVVNEDGQMVMPNMDANIAVRFNNDDDSVVTNLILNIQQLRLEREGRYSIDLGVDGREEASIPLFVRLIQHEEG